MVLSKLHQTVIKMAGWTCLLCCTFY